MIELRVPDLGDYRDVEVIDVLVKPGDPVDVDAAVITLETEKATMDVPAVAAGNVQEVNVKVGSRVSRGDLIATLATGGDVERKTEPLVQPATVNAESRPVTLERNSPGAESEQVDSHASPSVRKLARELGVDLAHVADSGRKGRITAEDVKSWVRRELSGQQPVTAVGPSLPKAPTIDFATFGPTERRPLSRIQRISGPRLHASWVNAPHVTQFDEADITLLEQKRVALKGEANQRGVKVTPLAFILRACALALKQFPQFCASLDADAAELIYKRYVHIGFAADTPNGLVVPVVRDADLKNIFELAHDLSALSEKARAGKLTAAEMSGGCFTVSSLGGIGGTAFTPIINAPELAILGVSRSAMKPVYDGGGFVPRLMLPLSLSYDHRAIDGAAAVRFNSFLVSALSDVESLLRQPS